MTSERFEVERTIAAPAADIFAVLTDPSGHAAIDSTGMLQWAEGDRVKAVGDSFVVHMDRESFPDYPLGKYDVTVVITQLEPDALIEWTIEGVIKPPLRHLYGYTLAPAEGGGTRVTSYYDWSQIDEAYRGGVFPVIPEMALRATLGILARTVESH
ncbi:MAG TPA: SRPBCC family protein [Mycobacteriales bacterium]|nr:SRPBCC family protein [Mycobacteriales bacterium]